MLRGHGQSPSLLLRPTSFLPNVGESAIQGCFSVAVDTRNPQLTRHLRYQPLKGLCPAMGKKRIAETLARAGLTLGVSRSPASSGTAAETGPRPIP